MGTTSITSATAAFAVPAKPGPYTAQMQQEGVALKPQNGKESSSGEQRREKGEEREGMCF